MRDKHDMVTTRAVTASREQVWAVIADGWTYTQWVVGNSRTRAVDARWPQPGAAIRHSVGIWPVLIDDQTVVESCTAGQELVLHAGLGPLGAMRITLQLYDTDDGADTERCSIEMTEVAAGGLTRLVPDRLVLLSVAPRNRECLWRLAAMAERREADQVPRRGK